MTQILFNAQINAHPVAFKYMYVLHEKHQIHESTVAFIIAFVTIVLISEFEESVTVNVFS